MHVTKASRRINIDEETWQLIQRELGGKPRRGRPVSRGTRTLTTHMVVRRLIGLDKSPQ